MTRARLLNLCARYTYVDTGWTLWLNRTNMKTLFGELMEQERGWSNMYFWNGQRILLDDKLTDQEHRFSYANEEDE